MKIQLAFVFACLLSMTTLNGQSGFSTDPLNAQFVTDDFDNFWKAFDELDTTDGNPFTTYLEHASPGLQPFVDYFRPELFYETAKARKADYLKARTVLDNLPAYKKRVQAFYAALKYWNPEATFPPIYFVVGVFTSGGTASDNGVLIGSEMLQNLNSLDGLIAHELIHFQQKIGGANTLLQQTIKEGSADFIGELVSGVYLSQGQREYGEAHEQDLCREFVKSMNNEEFGDWLYEVQTNGKPKDMAYWIGYKIVEAYFNQQEDKQQAIHDMLNMEDPIAFVKASGYLDPYLKEAVKK